MNLKMFLLGLRGGALFEISDLAITIDIDIDIDIVFSGVLVIVDGDRGPPPTSDPYPKSSVRSSIEYAAPPSSRPPRFPSPMAKEEEEEEADGDFS